jgi:hypothetical protein
MSTKRNMIAIVYTAAIAAAPLLHAQPAATGSDETQVWSGGVGEGAREALQAEAQGANLKLEFANPDGRYLADVKVVIQNRAGKAVLETISAGPWLFARLPAGSYTVIASTSVSRQSKAVRVGFGGRSTLLFHLREE